MCVSDSNPWRWSALYAATLLRRGGVMAYPTDTVWGLGCDPFNRQAVHRILELKGRPEDKGLILIVSKATQLGALYHDLSPAVQQRLASQTGRPTTWLVPDDMNRIPRWIKGVFSTVAVRVSAHPILCALSTAFNGPIVSTSANPAGMAPAHSRLRVQQYFGASLELVFPGEVQVGARPSIIRDAVSDAVLRD